MDLKSPYVYFGGKSKIAADIWQALGDVPNYVEPFLGSAAVLLARPSEHLRRPRIETVNDKDGFVCVSPETKILTADLRWKSAGEVQVGENLIGFDEHNGEAREGLRAPKRYRRWQRTTVTAIRRTIKPCYRLTFDDGTSVIASEDHLWLGGSHKSGGRGWRWVKTANMVCNRRTQRSWVLKLCDVTEPEMTYESGWLGGFADGEGHISFSPGWQAGITQRLGPELDRALETLKSRNFRTYCHKRNRRKENHAEVVHLAIDGGMRETLRFLMTFRPERLIRSVVGRIEGASLYGRSHHAIGLVNKEFLGDQEVVAIETASHTFVANGLASHNCNFWRAVQADAEKVAHYADWPSNENDLHARHAWLVGQRESMTARLEGDPEWFDAKIAGWWVWGMACWIGSEFCSGNGPWVQQDGQLVNTSNAGRGVQRKLIHLGDAGQGVQRQLIHLGTKRNLQTNSALYEWFDALQNRLRRVRVASGDWTRVMGDAVTIQHGVTGVVLDPPYTMDNREAVYNHDSHTIAEEVRTWAIANGDNPLFRIVYCGYEDGYVWPEGWRSIAWTAKGGYLSHDKGNRKRERLYLSPHCLQPPMQMSLFDLPGVA